MSETTFVEVNAARSDEQRQVLTEIARSGECPFCEDNFKKVHSQPIIKETGFWILTTNRWPYPNTKYHFLLIARFHVDSFLQLPLEAGAELFLLTAWLEEEYSVSSGALFIRFGDPTQNGSSVRHLHAHVIQPNGELRVKFGTPA